MHNRAQSMWYSLSARSQLSDKKKSKRNGRADQKLVFSGSQWERFLHNTIARDHVRVHDRAHCLPRAWSAHSKLSIKSESKRNGLTVWEIRSLLCNKEVNEDLARFSRFGPLLCQCKWMGSPTAANRRIVGDTNGEKNRHKKKMIFQFFMIYLFLKIGKLGSGRLIHWKKIGKLEFGSKCVNLPLGQFPLVKEILSKYVSLVK